ncbi:DUF3099 domain-containing protein [Streptomyces lavendulocolor]|uniref:DUF3099 domain-containing protein n=1 Tax=Streptomyces lavendulocolor TaxID=67316 RepID=UPI003F4D5957
MMTACLVLFVGAWAVVRLWSTPAAVAMCFVATGPGGRPCPPASRGWGRPARGAAAPRPSALPGRRGPAPCGSAPTCACRGRPRRP